MAYSDAILLMMEKIRALTEDFPQSATEAFTYETSNVFTLAEPRIIAVSEILINGQEMGSGQSATYDVTTNKVTVINPDFEVDDVVTVEYTFGKSSNSELFEYIRAALVWSSIYDSASPTYKLLSSGTIVPALAPKQVDMICIVASILIKPDYISYKTSNMSVTYPSKLSKEDKISQTIQTFQSGIGVVKVVTWDDCHIN
jgi:hypothetical protein